MSHRVVHAPRGAQLSCKGWHQEAALRCLMNNLDPDVAERPDELIVYGGAGKAARNWSCFDSIVRELKELENDETLLVQSGKPVAVFRTHEYAPRVLIANSNLVGAWANWEHFHELERRGLMMYGQMTAGSWIYIGTQGIVQGTFETFAAMADKQFAGDLSGKLIVSGGMGGMGGAQPLAATLNGAVFLVSKSIRRASSVVFAPATAIASLCHSTKRSTFAKTRAIKSERSRLVWLATVPRFCRNSCVAAFRSMQLRIKRAHTIL